MAMHADYVLTAVMVLMFLVASWLFRACEIYVSETQLHGNLLDAMWLVAITFLSVGYGDIFPHSYCGRTICVVTGIMGAACTALVVAVFARKLELSRSERYVHDFVIDVDLEKKRKHAAANILKAGWLVYKFKRIGSHAYHVRKYQRKLLKSIHTIREIKAAQRRLIDGAVTIIEMNKGQARLSRDVILIRERQN
ncbi:small conductance calcium-activated potassium channel protein 2-like [Liolophura sinensis]|uniref:small conductance calcium-activated potassium channel protein 2-like n=1 Tax=Liolophura sinensis TaxID=3198878 RepID=UPI0031589C23